MLKILSSNILINCKYCKLTFTYEDYILKKHLIYKCQEVNIKCYYCNTELLKKNLNTHIKQCIQVKERCLYCNNIYLKSYIIATNHIKICKNKEIECKFCNKTFLLKEEIKHLENCKEYLNSDCNINALYLLVDNSSNNIKSDFCYLSSFLYDNFNKLKSKYNNIIKDKDAEVKAIKSQYDAMNLECMYLKEDIIGYKDQINNLKSRISMLMKSLDEYSIKEINSSKTNINNNKDIKDITKLNDNTNQQTMLESSNNNINIYKFNSENNNININNNNNNINNNINEDNYNNEKNNKLSIVKKLSLLKKTTINNNISNKKNFKNTNVNIKNEITEILVYEYIGYVFCVCLTDSNEILYLYPSEISYKSCCKFATNIYKILKYSNIKNNIEDNYLIAFFEDKISIYNLVINKSFNFNIKLTIELCEIYSINNISVLNHENNNNNKYLHDNSLKKVNLSTISISFIFNNTINLFIKSFNFLYCLNMDLKSYLSNISSNYRPFKKINSELSESTLIPNNSSYSNVTCTSYAFINKQVLIGLQNIEFNMRKHNNIILSANYNLYDDNMNYLKRLSYSLEKSEIGSGQVIDISYSNKKDTIYSAINEFILIINSDSFNLIKYVKVLSSVTISCLKYIENFNCIAVMVKNIIKFYDGDNYQFLKNNNLLKFHNKFVVVNNNVSNYVIESNNSSIESSKNKLINYSSFITYASSHGLTYFEC